MRLKSLPCRLSRQSTSSRRLRKEQTWIFGSKAIYRIKGYIVIVLVQIGDGACRDTDQTKRYFSNYHKMRATPAPIAPATPSIDVLTPKGKDTAWRAPPELVAGLAAAEL